MKLRTLLFLTLLLAPARTICQEPNRFQQDVSYRIEATLEESTDVLRGRARLRYVNHSPDALDTLYFHQHLNAFRPNSAWARRESEYGERRFADLGPDEHAFERFVAVHVDGTPVRPAYPGAPDSTVAAIPLPRPLAAGDSAELLLDWEARLATVPRRQGRRGRHYDWAQWYPRIAVYEPGGWRYQPLLPQGEFYGEFGSYDVTLEVAADQVIGATGVPVEGDPGWTAAGDVSGNDPALGGPRWPGIAADPLGLLPGEAAAGRKRVRWTADDVHHFAWSAAPDFAHLGGELQHCTATPLAPVRLHVLTQQGDDWDPAAALQRTRDALCWLEGKFGPYPYPQLTNLHRIEGGGTEFPMVIMDGSDSEGLIVHESTHQYLHGILANNEWQDGWLDEGFTSFMTNWYFEEQGQEDVWERTMQGAVEREQAGDTQPIAIPGADFRDPATYSAMTYRKASLVFRMLRDVVGDEAFVSGLHLYYERNRFRHVGEDDLRAAMEEASGQQLDWFFQQWLHTVDQLDYGIGAVSTRRVRDGWRTRIEVLRLDDAWMPITLQVGDTVERLDGREQRRVVQIVTRERPREVVLDPAKVLLDVDRSNNRKPVP